MTLEVLELAPEEAPARTFEDEADIIENDPAILWGGGYSFRRVDVATLVAAKSGVLEPADRTSIWFESTADSYPVVCFWVYDDPERIDYGALRVREGQQSTMPASSRTSFFRVARRCAVPARCGPGCAERCGERTWGAAAACQVRA